jgi:hypothetical protein
VSVDAAWLTFASCAPHLRTPLSPRVGTLCGFRRAAEPSCASKASGCKNFAVHPSLRYSFRHTPCTRFSVENEAAKAFLHACRFSLVPCVDNAEKRRADKALRNLKSSIAHSLKAVPFTAFQTPLSPRIGTMCGFGKEAEASSAAGPCMETVHGSYLTAHGLHAPAFRTWA